MTLRSALRSSLGGLLLAALLCLAGTGSARSASPDFLAVDQAFATQIQRIDANHLAVAWQIADGYYLYRHALKFTLLNSTGQPLRDALGTPDIPLGNRHDDEFFGPVETYRHRLRVVIPVAGNHVLRAGEQLQVTYQGCADAGLCYPPQTHRLNIPALAAGTADRAPTTRAVAAEPARTVQPDNASIDARSLLDNSHSPARLAWTLLLFFGFGILLAFTPCVLPMVPILAGLIVGQATSGQSNSNQKGSAGRAFALSATYVVAMALAYTLFGVIAGYFGANIQAALQTPWVIVPFAALFLLLAAASFGWFELAVPAALQERAGRIGAHRHSLPGAALMGFFAALVVGPCVTPPLAGALAYISTQGNAILGGSALFVLGLGMGLPLVAMATLGPRILPDRGPWMLEIRVFFGVLLIAVALWLTTRVLASDTSLLLGGVLALIYGAYLSTRTARTAAAQTAQRTAVFLLWGYAAVAGMGLAAGGGAPLTPLAGFSTASTPQKASGTGRTDTLFARVPDYAALQQALAQARSRHQPVAVDFYADWCVECVRMAHGLFTEPAVHAALAPVARIQVDVTAYNADDRRILRYLGVFGPPTMVLIPADGDLKQAVRLVGTITREQLIRQLQALTQSHAGDDENPA